MTIRIKTTRRTIIIFSFKTKKISNNSKIMTTKIKQKIIKIRTKIFSKNSETTLTSFIMMVGIVIKMGDS